MFTFWICFFLKSCWTFSYISQKNLHLRRKRPWPSELSTSNCISRLLTLEKCSGTIITAGPRPVIRALKFCFPVYLNARKKNLFKYIIQLRNVLEGGKKNLQKNISSSFKNTLLYYFSDSRCVLLKTTEAKLEMCTEAKSATTS